MPESQGSPNGRKIGIEKGAPDFISTPVSCHCGLQPPPRTMTALRFIALSATCLALASCKNMQNSNGGDPYASNYGNDGHYNPYPNQSGHAQPSTPTYQTPPANPYAFGASEKTTVTPDKTTASSGPTKAQSAPAKSTAKKTSGSRHTVAKGDTLSGIARKKGTTVAKIRSANGLTGNLIRLGQSLKIP